MPTIFERIDKRLKKIDKINIEKLEKKIREEMIHQRIEEMFRGKDLAEKIKGIIKILSA